MPSRSILIDALSPTEEDHDRHSLVLKIPEPSAQMPKRALSRKSTFRRSNLGPRGSSGSAGSMVSTRLSRYSIDYSDYIPDEYGSPSSAAESFFKTAGGGENSPILRSISQRAENHLPVHYLRRTRSSETIASSAIAILALTDTIGSTPGKRLGGRLLKQGEYFPPEKATAVSILSPPPGTPRAATMRRARSAEFHRGAAGSSLSVAPLPPSLRADTAASGVNCKERKDQKKAKKKKENKQQTMTTIPHTWGSGPDYSGKELPPSSTGANPTPARPPPPSEAVEIAPSSRQRRVPGSEAPAKMI
ncbi:unnamed protein product [Tuber aestivum]|uniref:Uncharacterized protein n=1 Tax=Tuber aestivum TaxID=59557 RepID=A0A292Q127_9PEZI|nr:unnamed protein product [Tuber aestivum]